LKALAQSGKDRPENVVTTDAYLETLRRATAEVVRKQAAIGVDIISDGEFGKSSWSNYVLDQGRAGRLVQDGGFGQAIADALESPEMRGTWT